MADEAAIEGDPTKEGVTDDCETNNPVTRFEAAGEVVIQQTTYSAEQNEVALVIGQKEETG